MNIQSGFSLPTQTQVVGQSRAVCAVSHGRAVGLELGEPAHSRALVQQGLSALALLWLWLSQAPFSPGVDVKRQ